jgi:hypothetical protein
MKEKADDKEDSKTADGEPRFMPMQIELEGQCKGVLTIKIFKIFL